MSMKNPLTLAGIEPATFRFVAQHLNHCATAVPSLNMVLDGNERSASRPGCFNPPVPIEWGGGAAGAGLHVERRDKSLAHPGIPTPDCPDRSQHTKMEGKIKICIPVSYSD